MNHPITPLASAQINHDELKVELIEPLESPPIIRIVWPTAPSVIMADRFPDVAAALTNLFARAHIVLASLKAGGR
jgi:hypothetical protein